MEKEKESYWKDLPSLKEIQAAIPKNLFERSLRHSLLYLFVDILQVSSLIYLGTHIPLVPYFFVRVILWPIYWFILGTVATGLWVLAHECGHQGFSPYRSVNHFVGFILHSILLVPYHSWRISHGLHHKYNASMEKDQVYVPPVVDLEKYEKEKPQNGLLSAVLDSPVMNCLLMWVIGWPMYLFFGASGPEYKSEGWHSHFNPYFEIFRPKHRPLILLSDVGLLLWIFVLSMIAHFTSFDAILYHYIMPYLFVNFWLITYTYLQHTDPEIVHFRGSAWSFERGSSCTIDRDYGFFLNYFHHHIGDSHVAHHFFSAMPFYNAVKATPYIKKVLGKYYAMRDTPIVSSCFAAQARCRFVSNTGGIVSYRTNLKNKD